jgi:UDP-N-acetylmuramate dehydrogenase
MTFDTATAYQELLPHFASRVKQNESLARHSTFGVGGPADVWVSVETRSELQRLVSLCAERRWPLLVVGNSSNTIFSDAGVRGIVARMALTSYYVDQIAPDKALLVADAGVSWPHIIHELAQRNWGGLEFGVGIPGTLGGAIISNAGAHNQEIGEAVEWIEVLDARGANVDTEGYSYPILRRYQHDELDLGYRYSRFRTQRQVRYDQQGHVIAPSRHMIEPPEIVLQLGLRLHRVAREQLQQLLTQYKQERFRSEPQQPHRGSIFKDPTDEQVGRLIANVGMLGETHGNAQIAVDNANYIVNLGGARATAIVWLIEEVHRRVQERFGIDLQLDVELLGDWAPVESRTSVMSS